MSLEEIADQLRGRATTGDVLTQMVTPTEVAAWPPGTLQALLDDGVIERDQPEPLVECPECRQHWEPVQWVADRSVVVCPEVGPVEVGVSAMERWRVKPRANRQRLSAKPTAATEKDGEMEEPAYLFRRRGDYWDLRFDSSPLIHLKHSKGLDDISLLLRSPGQFIAARQLMQSAGSRGSTVSMAQDGLSANRGQGVPLADQQAIHAVLDRKHAIDEELSAATDAGEIDEWADLKDERSKLEAYLGSVSDDRGAPRATGGHAENARTAVTKRIQAAFRQIEKHNRQLALHLEQSIKTGLYLQYDLEMQVPWTF